MYQQVITPQSRRSMAEKHSLNAKLYDALGKEDATTVKQLCEDLDEHGLHILTINDDTVLQAATFAKMPDLVLGLLEDLPDRHFDKLTRQNHVGNTILHEAAISNQSLEVAKKLLQKAPGLLCMRNHLGESALFRTARYGKRKMFNFLAGKISGYDEENQKLFLRRTDKTTILHMAILAHHFELALEIGNKFEQLVREQDGDGMTALQLLSCNPGAFQHDDGRGLLEQIVNTAARKQEQRYQSALRLAKFLIERDTSWETTYPPSGQTKPILHKYRDSSMSSQAAEDGATKKLKGETKIPLFLATKSGYVEIVQEIIKLYPQSVEHVDDKGRNILHIAIKYRQLKIFELVTKMGLPLSRLERKLDLDGNSILHTVGKKIKDYVPEKMQGPALELQEELHWFERVKKVTPSHFIAHRNNQRLTAEGLFQKTNNVLRQKAVEWIKRTSEGCSIMAVLIATVAFAAAYTVPGGTDEDTGYPVLVHHPFFAVFTVADVLSISFALTSVVVFLAITTSPFRLVDFSHSLPNKLRRGLTLLFLSVFMMMIALGATILLMIHKGEDWTKTILYAVAFMPVGLFALSYFPLYLSLSKTFENFREKAWRVISLSRPRETNFYTRTSNPSNHQSTMSV
ncbi:ankyrin repeat-containing protein At5g02620-like isoform X3 [Quercus lobata]|uniref:ankyrin repeat-containing protein At5g02620-like isoform X3 n=1 Tax=Quercus lobata TaxID=97700 RepID=UPI0012454E6D|nr:ankyrin repeat-containing protein At5g02620-like isoform X3 [Quercus lobata]